MTWFHVYIYINIIIQYVIQCICIYHALGLSGRNPWSWRMEIVLVHVWKILLAICGKASISTISTWFSAVGMSVYVPIESPIDKFCWFNPIKFPWTPREITFFLSTHLAFGVASLCSFGPATVVGCSLRAPWLPWCSWWRLSICLAEYSELRMVWRHLTTK